MIELILMLSLGGLAADTTLAGGPFTTCQWPSKCAKVETVALFQPCVWPNQCKNEVQTAVLAQFQPCVWPNRCKDALTVVF